MPLALFRSAQFSAANAVTFAVYGGLGGALFLLPVELQEVAGYSPLEAGAALLPVTAAHAAAFGPVRGAGGPDRARACRCRSARSSWAPGWPCSRGRPGQAATSPRCSRPSASSGSAWRAPSPRSPSTVLAAAPAEHAGVASAINNDVARTASLVAVAVLPAVAGITGDSYTHPAALAASFRTAMLVAGAVCAAGGVLAMFTIRNPPAPGPALAVPDSHCALDAPPLRPGTPLTPPAAH